MKFSCQRCGLCCKSEENEDFLGVRIFDFEAKRIREKYPDVAMQPALTISDKKSKKALVVLYSFNEKICPLYVDNACSIYEDRPIICRAFPIITSGKFSNGEIVRSIACKGNILLKKGNKEPANIKEVIDIYSDSYLYCVLFEDLLQEIRQNINNLIKDKQIIMEPIKGKYELEDISAKFRITDAEYIFEEIKALKKTKAKFGVD